MAAPYENVYNSVDARGQGGPNPFRSPSLNMNMNSTNANPIVGQQTPNNNNNRYGNGGGGAAAGGGGGPYRGPLPPLSPSQPYSGGPVSSSSQQQYQQQQMFAQQPVQGVGSGSSSGGVAQQQQQRLSRNSQQQQQQSQQSYYTPTDQQYMGGGGGGGQYGGGSTHQQSSMSPQQQQQQYYQQQQQNGGGYNRALSNSPIPPSNSNHNNTTISNINNNPSSNFHHQQQQQQFSSTTSNSNSNNNFPMNTPPHLLVGSGSGNTNLGVGGIGGIGGVTYSPPSTPQQTPNSGGSGGAILGVGGAGFSNSSANAFMASTPQTVVAAGANHNNNNNNNNNNTASSAVASGGGPMAGYSNQTPSAGGGWRGGTGPSAGGANASSTFNGIDTSRWRLSDLELKETLGTGTFGRVRLCKHKSSQQFFALKMIKKQEIIRMKQVDHILSEASILKEIRHPFIVNMVKGFADEDRLYLLMELVVGGEMFSHLRKAGKFPNDVAKFYCCEVLLAFEYLHERHIIYRDLKPENILLDDGGHIKIADFGFAKRVTERTFTLCGTPEYIAPEVIQSRGHGKAVDYWAMGILLYEMIVGYPPFFDDSPFKTYEKILEGKLQFPKWVDPKARDIIRGLLTLDHTKRLGTLRRGMLDLKKHNFFAGVDWEVMLSKKIPAPIPVRVAKEGDSRYFDRYPESIPGRDPLRPLTSQQQELFRGFCNGEYGLT